MRVIDTISHNLTAPAVAYLAGIREDGQHTNHYLHGSIRIPSTCVLICPLGKDSEWQQALRVYMSGIHKDAKLPRLTATVTHAIDGSMHGVTPIKASYCLLSFKSRSLAINIANLNFDSTNIELE